jgi:RNA polymerase sigma-70 factor (ECF subfamily)
MKAAQNKSSATDIALLRRAQTGDPKAFAELVRRNEDMIYSFAFKVCRNKAFAEETLQDTFVNVFQKLKQFDGKSKFSTWLYSIVANNCLMKHRRRKLEKSSVSIEEPVMPKHSHSEEERQNIQLLPVWRQTPLDETMTSELRQLLDTSIQQLPVDYRLVFILRDIEGRSAEETAKIMKLSIPATKSRLRRARVFLREQLKEYMTA